MSDLARIFFATVLVLFTISSSRATLCSIWETPSSCNGKFTDSGGCRWDAAQDRCVASGEPLPEGTYAVAIVELDPKTAPPELKPGATSSSGSTGDPELLSPDLRPASAGREDDGGTASLSMEAAAPSPESEDEESANSIGPLNQMERKDGNLTWGVLGSVVTGQDSKR